MPHGVKINSTSGTTVLDTSTFLIRVPIYTSGTITAAGTTTVSGVNSLSILDTDITFNDATYTTMPKATLNTSTGVVTVVGSGSFSLVFTVFDLL